MAREIERKFLLKNDSWKKQVTETLSIKQGYLANTTKASIRIRRQNDNANINIKAAVAGVSREEFEYGIPISEAEYLLKNLCLQPTIDKQRHIVLYVEHKWEIDVFEGENKGLVVAEIELSASNEYFEKPEWLGEEVTEDIKYYNSSLRKKPFSQW
jgi:adenylate cyclase